MLLWIVAVLGLCLEFGVQGIKFCTWAEKPRKAAIEQYDTTVINKRSRTEKKSETHNEENDFIRLLRKNDEFRSYQPHYLHSYSYPQPITPHFYFGQRNSNSAFTFLVKQNETLDNKSIANEIFYVNGKQEYGSRNLLEKPGNLRLNVYNLNFAMVAQIENKMEAPVYTRMSVYNFGNFLGVICEIYFDYIKSFIVYISENGKKAVNITESMQEEFKIKFKNLGTFSNMKNWKYAHEPERFRDQPEIKLSTDSSIPNYFTTFVFEIDYKSIEAAKRYKVAIREFPFPEEEEEPREFRSVQEALNEMRSVNVNSFEFKFQIAREKELQSCEIKAERQLLRGLSYQYGNLMLKNGSQPLPNLPKELLSFSPSRKRFPWGFLWDDGFHCEVAVRSSPQIALEVIKSWLDTMHDFGWIPREQNRGPERQFLCNCPQFMAKDIRDGNPPTLLLALNFLARTSVLNKQNFEEKYWKKLQSWYKWFIQTQSQSKDSFIFRWHDSIKGSGSFNSGLDDFPRLEDSYGHVDCQAWMYFFAQTMQSIRDKLQMIGGTYSSDAYKIKSKLLENFVSPITKVFNDYSNSSNQIKFNSHFGYPSLLPIAFGMVSPNHEAYTATIEKLKDELDSGHGITSLSKKDNLYLENRDAYWKGPVWININYLFLRGLSIYYKGQKELYNKLRKDLITTVCSEEDKKGYFYENYINGTGSFSYPFTGWTALISIIIRENY